MNRFVKILAVILIFSTLVAIIYLFVTRLTETKYVPNSDVKPSCFQVIEDKEYLSYDKDTHIIYYLVNEDIYSGYKGYGHSYFAPYISENGKFCKYIDGKIVEIENTNN